MARTAAAPADDPSATLQSRLEVVDSRPPGDPAGAPDGGRSPSIAEPVDLLRQLEESGRFHRDTGFGRIFHPGSVSFRENSPTDSLHVVVHHNRVAAHVDRVSPLGLREQRPSRYSLRRGAAHNVSELAQNAVRLLRGRQGDHRSRLDCEWVDDPSACAPDPRDLLDPKESAWSVQLEARVGGALDESRLRAALWTALGGRPANYELLEVVDCADDASLDAARAELQSTPVGVTDPPLRAGLARHPDGDVLMLNLNHAAADGFGAVHVLRTIAETYAGEADGRAPVDFLAVRELPVRPASAPVSHLVGWYRTSVERLRDLLARPARIAPDESSDVPGWGFHQVSLSADDTAMLVRADRPGTSRNALMAALHLAIGDWNLLHGAPGRRVGVLVPVNLRPPDWPEETMGNFSVTARVSTSRRHRAGPASALAAITGQTTRNKRSRTGTALLAALDRSGLLPLWAKQSLVVLQPLTGNRLVDAALLANLGPIDEPPSFGDDAGPTVEMWFSAPTRAPQGLCIGAVTIDGRLHLTLRYPHRLFGAEAARRFADCYLAQIRSVARTLS